MVLLRCTERIGKVSACKSSESLQLGIFLNFCLPRALQCAYYVVHWILIALENAVQQTKYSYCCDRWEWFMCVRKCKGTREELKGNKKLRSCKCEKIKIKIELFNIKMAWFEIGFKLACSSWWPSFVKDAMRIIYA